MHALNLCTPTHTNFLLKFYVLACVFISYALFCSTEKDVKLPNCFITPVNPSFLPADGGINNGTLNVMMKCNCISSNYQEMRWYSRNEDGVTVNNSKSKDNIPYYIQKGGTLTLTFPKFSDPHQGTYYCGVGNASMLDANISLTLWTGMYILFNAFHFLSTIC